MLHFTEYDTRLAAYAVIVDDEDRILLALWNEVEPQLWTMPGGGVELDETPDEGVVREVREETGYDVELVGLLGVNSNVIPAADRADSDRPAKSVRLRLRGPGRRRRAPARGRRHHRRGALDPARPGARRAARVHGRLGPGADRPVTEQCAQP